MKKHQIILALFILLAGCEKSTTPDPCFCSGTENCTDIFVSVGLTIKNQNGEPYILDSYSIKRVSTDENFDPSLGSRADSIARSNGAYGLASDKDIKHIQKCGEDFLFTGTKNGRKVVEKTYTIAHDCCHVKILKGEIDMVIAQ